MANRVYLGGTSRGDSRPVSADRFLAELSSDVTQDVIAGSYVLQSSDNGRVKRSDSAAPITVTVPGNLPEGFSVGVLQWGAGAVTFAPGSGAVGRSTAAATSKQYGFASVLVGKNSTGGAAEYVLGGDVA